MVVVRDVQGLIALFQYPVLISVDQSGFQITVYLLKIFLFYRYNGASPQVLSRKTA